MSEQKPPTPSDGGSGTPPAAPVTPPPPAAPAQTPFVITKEEWVDYRRENRQIKELLSKMTPAAPAAPPSDDGKGKKGEPPPVQIAPEVQDRLARFELSEAIDESGLSLTREQKAYIKRLFVAEKPQNAREWLSDAVKILPAPAAAPSAAAPAPVPPPAPTAPSNSGAPAPTPAASNLPEDPRQWPPEIVSKMSAEDFHKALGEYERRKGRGNPVAGIRSQLDRRVGRSK